MDGALLALLELGQLLASEGYHFVTPTPETHRRVLTHRAYAADLRDVFGWSRPFARSLLPPRMRELLRQADALVEEGDDCRSRVRFSTLERGLYVHSAYPTNEPNAVFFGPDTYRFCAFLRRTAPRARTVVDIGCGSGAGGLSAARAAGATRLVLADINPRALAFAQVNARLAHAEANWMSALAIETPLSDVLQNVAGPFDLIVANPPYMRDEAARAYRHGGGEWGEGLSVRIVREALPRLSPGGTLLLYTGAAIIAGQDVFQRAIREQLRDYPHQYEELDPDVFGEQLEQPGYEHVERIAAVGLTVRRPA